MALRLNPSSKKKKKKKKEKKKKERKKRKKGCPDAKVGLLESESKLLSLIMSLQHPLLVWHIIMESKTLKGPASLSRELKKG
jgi:hypothetical protein